MLDSEARTPRLALPYRERRRREPPAQRARADVGVLEHVTAVHSAHSGEGAGTKRAAAVGVKRHDFEDGGAYQCPTFLPTAHWAGTCDP